MKYLLKILFWVKTKNRIFKENYYKMATFEDLIKADQLQRLRNIALSFKESDPEIIKGLTEDEFNSKYTKENYEIYSEAAINKYKGDLQKALGKEENKQDVIEKAKKEIEGLKQVNVIGDKGFNKFFVKSK